MRKLSLILILFIIFTASGCQTTTTTDVQASGIIEATEVSVAAELSGRVLEVNASTGDTVQAGDTLVVLDDTQLQSQKKAAQAQLDAANAGIQTAQTALDSAQAQYDLALSMAQAEEFASFTWEGKTPTEFEQPLWYFSRQEKLQSAQHELESAQTSLEDAMTTYSEIAESAGSSNFLKIEQQLSDARIAYEVAQAVYDKTGDASDATELRDEGQTALDNAETDLNDTQQDYEDALTTDGANDVLKARANVEVAHQRYMIALDTVRSLQTGENSLSLIAQSKVVDQAKAALAQVKISVSAAQANVDLIDDQIAMLTVKAPMDGTVLVSSIQPGEVIQAGMSLMKIGKLDSLKVTVYIPETDYGKIKLGQQVSLSVDSFPNQTFHATVTRIADQAEFTPQNVQTKEGRQTTVYAVELSIDNADGKLKPGMPVDVTFDNTGSSQ
jgi:HlyD family secretion protein